jgi:TonB family protein
MRFSWGRTVTAFALSALFAGSVAFAQQSTDEGKRKPKSKVTPTVSELARKMNITGKVKVEVVIAPDGRVKSARAVGGHPLLVQPCLDAVSMWKFDAAPEESTQVIEFDFKNQQ